MRSLIIVAILFPFIAYSQCKFDINETDEFTGQLVQLTKGALITPVLLNTTYSVSMAFKQVDSSYQVRMFVTFNVSEFTIDTTDMLFFKLSDESIMKLRPKYEVIGIEQTLLGVTARRGDVYYDISVPDIERLKNNTIKESRVYYNESYIGIKIRKDDAEQMMVEARCITAL